MSSVSQRVTDVCYHFSRIFEFPKRSTFNASASTDDIKGEEIALSARQLISQHDYAYLTPDVYLESFTTIIAPIQKGETAYCDNDIEGLSWQCTYTCPFVERDVVCLTNRLVLRLTNRARGHKLV